MTPDELVQEVRDEMTAEPWKDPALYPDCLSQVIASLGELAREPWKYDAGEWAIDLLHDLRIRAQSGVPFGEPWGDQPPPPEDL